MFSLSLLLLLPINCALSISCSSALHGRVWRTPMLHHGNRVGSLSANEPGGSGQLSGAWRIQQARLDAEWSASVRRRKPRWLPFHQARQWARAMWFATEKDWRTWISNGEKRNPYIPSNPEVVYADDWISWSDFLNGPFREEPN